MMERLTLEQAKENKFTPIDCVKYYFPNMSEDNAVYLLMNETCFPMDMEGTLEQLYGRWLFYNSENVNSAQGSDA